MATRRNPHVGSSAGDLIREKMAKDPALTAGVRAEFDRLQLARRVRALRERRKMSQSELAARAGTKQPAIARLESGRVVPDLGMLERIARALGMRVDVRFVSAGG